MRKSKLPKLTEFTDGDYSVLWQAGKTRHVITNGLQVKTFNNSLDACHEFGECVRHSLECAGKLDERVR